MFIRALLFFSVLGSTAVATEPFGPQTSHHVTAELVAETTSVRPGETIRVGLRLEHTPKWHTYWKITATGYSPSLEWDLPEGIEAGEIQWTVPQPYEALGYIEYVYEGEVLLPVEITMPANAEVGSVTILRAEASWLMCTDSKCIPGSVELALALPVEDNPPPPNTTWTELFAAADQALPRTAPNVNFTAWHEGESYFLLVESNEAPLPDDLYFFDSQLLITPTMEQEVDRLDDRRALLRMAVDPAGGASKRFEGVLTTRDSTWQIEGKQYAGITVDVPLGNSPPAEVLTAITSLSPPAPAAPSSLALIAALAFVGGLLLNLMPCVFPIIGIKVMGFVNQAGSERRAVIVHGLTFTAGILISFWVLAGVLMILRASGEQLGWGFQLQSPGFNFALIIIFLLFALNLSGVFEIGQSVMGVGSNLAHQSGYTGTFFSGVLATVVATPCSAPILGTALGALMALPPFQQFLAFTAMALGLAFPYLTLSAFPKLISFLPKPGIWMESFKQAMSFFLYGAVAYLVWVLAGQLLPENGFTDSALGMTFAGILLIAVAAWIYGRWGAAFRSRRARRNAYTTAAACFGLGILVGYPAPYADRDEAPLVQWEPWEPGKAETLAADGKIVFVDFTARWCVTCQSNKALVFGSAEVRQRFHDLEVVSLRADWTNHDPRITEALRQLGRSAIPVNLIHAPGLDAPLLLPELLTPQIVLERLDRATP